MRRDVLPESPAEERAILEELSGTREIARPSRAWLLALATMAAIVGFGFAGQTADAPEAVAPVATPELGAATPTSTAVKSPIEILEPTEGESVATGFVRVVVRSAAPGAHLHLAIELGDAVLGWANVDAGADGIAAASIRVFSPAAMIPVMLRAAGVVGGVVAMASRSIAVGSPGRPIGWQVALLRPASGRRVLRIEGTAPLAVREIRIRATVGSSDRSTDVTLPNRVDPYLPGSAGGRLLGLGSFRGDVLLPGGTRGPIRVRLSWTDPADGSHGSADCVVRE